MTLLDTTAPSRESLPADAPAEESAPQRSFTSSAELTHEEIERIGAELDAIRDEVMNDLGAEDAAYIRGIIRTQRSLELASRVVLLFSIFPPAWIVGTLGLSVSKILENMEIGHNVLHGQWDWMRDPKIHSTTWEWDAISPAYQWQASHNVEHHHWTNVIGKDNDLGYGIMRVDEKQPWSPGFLVQPITAAFNAITFQYGIAAYDAKVGPFLRGEVPWSEFRELIKPVAAKMVKQAGKDYVAHPLLSGPSFLPTLAANLTANVVRNVWSNSVIICGHFPEGVEVFQTESADGESRAMWYLRQMLGSANISGSKLLHIMTGNLSHQIEHHLYPDMPSNRLAQVAPRIRAIFDEYGLHYATGPMHRQLGSVWAKIFKLSLPNPEPGRSRAAVLAGHVGELGGKVRDRVRRRLPRQAAVTATA